MPRRLLFALVILTACFAWAGTGRAIPPVAPVDGAFRGHHYIGKAGGGPVGDLVFLHVRPQARPNGDGSFERPFAEIGPALEKAADGNIVYLWPGVYPAGMPGNKRYERIFSISVNLTLAGAGTPLALPGAGSGHLPRQAKGRVILRAGNLWNAGLDHAPLVDVAPGVDLTLSGLELESDGSGIACAMGRRSDTDFESGRIVLQGCAIKGFEYGVYSNGPIDMLYNNTLRDNHWGLASNGHSAATMRLSGHNRLSGGRDTIYNPFGLVDIDRENVAEKPGASIFAGDIRFGNHNISRDGGRFELSANKSITIGDHNQIGTAQAHTALTVGNKNVIASLLTRKGNLHIGDNNTLNSVCTDGDGVLWMGDGNTVSGSRNNGLENRQGPIIIGDNNTISGNKRSGIVALGGEITLGRNNRITANGEQGIGGAGLLRLGGGCDITGNNLAFPGDPDIHMFQPGATVESTPTDKLGRVHLP